MPPKEKEARLTQQIAEPHRLLSVRQKTRQQGGILPTRRHMKLIGAVSKSSERRRARAAPWTRSVDLRLRETAAAFHPGEQAGRGFSFRTVKKKERPSGTRALSSRRMSPSPSD